MATRVQFLRQNRFAVLRALRARPGAVRLVATLGSVVVTAGLYVPSAGRDLLFHGNAVRRYFRHLDHRERRAGELCAAV